MGRLNISKLWQHIKNSVDWPLAIFLVLFLHVSLGVKALAVVFMYVMRPNFKFGFGSGRLPMFYALMVCFAVVQLLVNFSRGLNYQLLGMLVLSFWVVSFLVMHQLKYAIEKSGVDKVSRTLDVFFVLNALVSAWDLIRIMWSIHDINPYTFDGLSYKYSASTGDYIKGLSRDLSTVNMITNALGLVYYFLKGRYWMATLCFVVAVFTTSNLGNIILFIFFAYVLFFGRSGFNRSLILCYIGFMVFFIVKISPSNLNYMNHKFTELLHLKEPIIKVHFEDNKVKEDLINRYIYKYHKELINRQKQAVVEEKIFNLREKVDSVPKTDTVYVQEMNSMQLHFAAFYMQHYGDTTKLKDAYYFSKPGKMLSFFETMDFLKSGVSHFLIGAGGGNFSSKLAYKASNLGVSGKYVQKYAYIAPEFKAHHLKLSMSYFLKSSTEHSIINSPNSTLNQLLGEYGVVGLLLFLVFYVAYFLQRFKQLSFGRVLLPVCLIFMLTDYWFESMSILILFELLMFVDLETKKELVHD